MARTAQRQRWVSEAELGQLLDQACARAASEGAPLAVIRLALGKAPPAGELENVLRRSLRAGDVVAAVDERSVEVLSLDADRDGATSIHGRLCRRFLERGIPANAGAAVYPEDGASAAALRAVAAERCQKAAAESPARSGPAAQLDLLVQKIARSQISVLILGETGVGKERLAEKIHRLSPRAAGPFVRLNCAALTESLLESELFGYEKGAFTGAVGTKPGLIETAEGGTLFLDEVGDLPLTTQVKLLRVLEERQVLRVGGLQPRNVDVRFVSATNKNLEAAIAAGTYREDLYFRLNGVSVVVPPLRERIDELEPLARQLMRDATRGLGRAGATAITRSALDVMRAYHWPGNIRELRNVIDRALVLCSGGAIEPSHLPLERMQARPSPRAAEAAEASPTSSANPDRRERVLRALDDSGGNQTKAARLLEISRRTLFNWMEELGISGPRKPR